MYQASPPGIPTRHPHQASPPTSHPHHAHQAWIRVTLDGDGTEIPNGNATWNTPANKMSPGDARFVLNAACCEATVCVSTAAGVSRCSGNIQSFEDPPCHTVTVRHYTAGRDTFDRYKITMVKQRQERGIQNELMPNRVSCASIDNIDKDMAWNTLLFHCAKTGVKGRSLTRGRSVEFRRT